MRYLKINVKSGEKGEMIYPVDYQIEIGNFAVDHLYYEESGTCKLLLCIPDKAYKETMIRADVEEITELDAKAISEAKETRVEIIKDEAKVRRLEIKSRAGMVLTQDEKDSLDITKANSAFGKSEILADRITKLKADEKVK